MDDKKYWENYYKKNVPEIDPSLFAKYVLNKYLLREESLVELGCGNGRDSLFFSKNGIRVIAIDQCRNEISNLEKLYGSPTLRFIAADFTNLDDFERIDSVYSRFTLHSINVEGEDRVISWISRNINPGGKIFIEVRGQKNELYKKGTPVRGEPNAFIYKNHYRRFLNIEVIKQKIMDIGFFILEAIESSGFAPFEGTDYFYIRIIAKKNSIP